MWCAVIAIIITQIIIATIIQITSAVTDDIDVIHIIINIVAATVIILDTSDTPTTASMTALTVETVEIPTAKMRVIIQHIVIALGDKVRSR